MDQRIILHIDMNAFFASVEQQANPALRGKPIVVTGGGKRTIIVTASYEARKYGIKTGMTVWEAKQKCPDVIVVVADNRKYTYTSAQIADIFRDYTPLVEVFSIDEAFLDVTHSLSIFHSAERIAYLIKSRIKHRFGITCSIGIAPNKLLAKLASDMQKPDGLTIIRQEEVSRTLERMPITELCGIGSRLARQLALYSIKTCGDLGRYPVDRLKRKFGVIGERLHYMALGVDESPVIPLEEQDEVKSVGHSMTLEHDISTRDEILRFLLQLSEMVGRRARRYKVCGKTVTLTIRYADFSTFSKQDSQTNYLSMSDDIYKAAVRILDTIELEQPIRLLGVRISNLRYEAQQMPLFHEERRKQQITEAMDEVNNIYGDFTITFASLIRDRLEKNSRVISPAWRPEGIRYVNVV